MPYKRQLLGKLVWMASYYVPNEMLPISARKETDSKGRPVSKTRIYEPATEAGFPNTKPAAAQLEAQRRREISKGTYSYSAQGEHTASTWVVEWTEGRSTRARQTDKRRVEMHFLTFSDFATRKLRDFRTEHFRAWAKHGREIVASGQMKAAKTFRNAYGVVHTMFQDAVVNGKIAVNPCVVSRSDLPTKKAKKGRRYENEESEELVWCLKLPVDVRMLFCILSYTGTRVGEGCGFEWANWDPQSATDLGALTLEWAYDRLPLKTTRDKERPRVIPVHPELASALEWWKREGWEAFYGRPPRDDDPIVPNQWKRGHHTEKSIYHHSFDAFEAAKVTWKGHHACRHSFMTTARRRGAIELYIERITHNASGSIVDHYTHTEWEPLCAVIKTLPWVRVRSTPTPSDPEGGGTLATALATDSKEQLDSAANLSGRRDSKPPLRTENNQETAEVPGVVANKAGNEDPLRSAAIRDQGKLGAARRQTAEIEHSAESPPRAQLPAFSAAAWGLVFAADRLGVLGRAG